MLVLLAIDISIFSAVELLADLLRNSRIDDASLEQERSLILRQLDQAENYPQAVVLDYLHDAAFQGTPMAKSAMGTSESIRLVSVYISPCVTVVAISAVKCTLHATFALSVEEVLYDI